MKFYLKLIFLIITCLTIFSCSKPTVIDKLVGKWNLPQVGPRGEDVVWEFHDVNGFNETSESQLEEPITPGTSPRGYHGVSAGGVWDYDWDSVKLDFEKATKHGKPLKIKMQYWGLPFICRSKESTILIKFKGDNHDSLWIWLEEDRYKGGWDPKIIGVKIRE